MNWDDLKIISAINRHQTFARAGRGLGVDATTIARRLARIEQSAGYRMFATENGKRIPTRQCLDILQHLKIIEQQVAAINTYRPDTGQLTGRLRIAATNATAETFLSASIAGFLQTNPGISLQLDTSDENVSFSNWEADLAIRLARPQTGSFAITRLADFPLCLIEPARPGNHMVCAYPDYLADTAEMHELQSLGLADNPRLVTSNLSLIDKMLQSANAIAILPAHRAEQFASDKRLKIQKLATSRQAWLLIQPHLKNDPVARLVVDWIKSCFTGQPG